jgi:hypothetical protein
MSERMLERREFLGAGALTAGAIGAALGLPAGAVARSTDRSRFDGTYLQVIDVPVYKSFRGVLLVAPGGGIVATSSDYRSDIAGSARAPRASSTQSSTSPSTPPTASPPATT